ncbi:Rossmann-like and DUF2520 domain-containing protein [Salinimicrobium oceani]|uniref:DUF2520 domain-containing protein n=1 Tax=Salinimicrobium oceani TaxID=2722702 RepID=A0ABX1CZM1_9FLAO|nr:DUF2520 domain-containing protein [Salinimicrobium oceani]NJW52562.1 DUF2520 domain-containing protein [Salinimicrobium oceani]
MIEIIVLGSGNVATHLFKAFSAAEGVNVKQVYNHAEASLDFFKGETKTTSKISELAEADIFLLALKDDVIPQIAEKLSQKNGLIVHTSGSVPLDALSTCTRRGVFYPLQTFSKEKTVDYSQIPFCLETNRVEDLQLLKDLAGKISGKAYEISSQQRKQIHLSAVFVCNFVNHLYAVGEQLCQKGEIPFEILKPLISETAKKIEQASPAAVQTGPAMRNDVSTINTHLELLGSSENRKIYELLTSAIQSFHGKKL